MKPSSAAQSSSESHPAPDSRFSQVSIVRVTSPSVWVREVHWKPTFWAQSPPPVHGSPAVPAWQNPRGEQIGFSRSVQSLPSTQGGPLGKHVLESQ